MIAKRNVVRETPEDKEKIGKIIFLSVVLLVIGTGFVLFQHEILGFLLKKTQYSDAYDVLSDFRWDGFYNAIQVLILFFIAIKSRTPAHSALFVSMFIIPGYVIDICRYFQQFNVNLQDQFIYSLIKNDTLIIALTVAFYYCLWYGKGKGKFADAISAVAVGLTLASIGYPAFDIYTPIYWHNAAEKSFEYTKDDYIKIITACIVIAILIVDALIMMLVLKKTAKKRVKLLLYGLIIGLVLGTLYFLFNVWTTPIATDTPMA